MRLRSILQSIYLKRKKEEKGQSLSLMKKGFGSVTYIIKQTMNGQKNQCMSPQQ